MQPLRAIILRCTSSVAHGAIVRVMQKIPFEFCGSLGFRRCRYPDLSDESQPWFYSSDTRHGVYEGVNHAKLLPLDEEVIVRMRDCEALFMYMMTRHEYARIIPYVERKQVYLLHLRFWNDFLERHHINLFLSSTLPHEIPDYIIYALCKLKGIPTIFSHATPIRDTAFLLEDAEESAVQIKKRLDELNADESVSSCSLRASSHLFFPRSPGAFSRCSRIEFYRHGVCYFVGFRHSSRFPCGCVACTRCIAHGHNPVCAGSMTAMRLSRISGKSLSISRSSSSRSAPRAPWLERLLTRIFPRTSFHVLHPRTF